MDITTETLSGLEQEICIFKTPLKEDEVSATVKQQADIEQLFEDDKEKYASSIDILDWKEVILVLSRHNSEINTKNLELLATSSYHIQAIRKGAVDDIIPVLVEGLILTNDNKFVYGVRGRAIEKGKVCIVPAGSISNQYKGSNPIFGNFYEELTEELGIAQKDIEDCILQGYQTDPEFTKGINFVLHGRTSYNSFELDDMHKEALIVYQKALESGSSAEDARKVIEGAGYPNIDAWEHEKLIFIDNDIDSIKKIILSRKIEHEGEQYPLLDIGRGPLIMLNEILNKKKDI